MFEQNLYIFPPLEVEEGLWNFRHSLLPAPVDFLVEDERVATVFITLQLQQGWPITSLYSIMAAHWYSLYTYKTDELAVINETDRLRLSDIKLLF